MMGAHRFNAEPTLATLLAGLVELPAQYDVPVHGLALDSRKLIPGALFIALAGRQGHGLDHLAAALAAGCTALVCDADDEAARTRLAAQALPIPVLAVPQLRERLPVLAARYYGEPARALRLVGITGTNGKTSISHFIAQALDAPGRRCGIIGTLGAGLPDALAPGQHTTPDPITLQAALAALRDTGARTVAMEVSSHALDQGRVAGLDFEVAVFSNLSRDHLDYHADMADYAAAKRRLFGNPALRHAVVNLDDAEGRALASACADAVMVSGYTLNGAPGAQLVARALTFDDAGLHLVLDTPQGAGELHAALLGRFNAANLLAALGALLALGLPLAQALERLSRVRAPAGRMECFGGGEQPLVVVDYAHTPDALEQALGALRAHARGRLWCVFGCGGERDSGKRAAMGEIAERLADHLVITDDNPRGEDPIQIVADILSGMHDPDRAYLHRERSQAIGLALREAGTGDVVLVAGKGHEDYQDVNGVRRAYSDRATVTRLLAEVSA